jgi:hypothetical protein
VPGPGDVALAALIRLHKAKTIGGLAHAVAFLSTEDFYAGISAYRYFGLDEVVSVLEAAKLCGSDQSALDLLELRYGELVPSDDVLTAAFETVYLASPSDFAPF